MELILGSDAGTDALPGALSTQNHPQTGPVEIRRTAALSPGMARSILWSKSLLLRLAGRRPASIVHISTRSFYLPEAVLASVCRRRMSVWGVSEALTSWAFAVQLLLHPLIMFQCAFC